MLIGPYLAGFLLYLGAGAGQIGFITALPLLMNAIIVIPSAFLMEKYTNRYKTVFITVLVYRLLFCAAGLIPFLVPADWRVGVFIVVFLLVCVAGSMSSAPFNTLLADMVPPSMRASYLGIRFSIMGAAGSITLLIAGWGLDRMSQKTGFAMLFAVAGVVSIINMIHIGRYPNIPYKPSDNGITLKYLLKPLRDKSFLASILFVSFWVMAQGSTVSMFSYAMIDIMHVRYEWVGISNTLLAAVSIIAYAVWGKLNTRWSNRKLLLWVFPLNAVSIMLWGIQAFLSVEAMLIVVYIFLGVSMAGFQLLVFNFIISDTPERERPMYFAVYATISGLFGFFGPVLGGLVFGWMDGAPLWMQEYGFFMGVGCVMLLASLTVSFRVFSEKE